MAGMMPEQGMADQAMPDQGQAEAPKAENGDLKSLVSDDDQKPNVSEEEQAAYEDFVLAGFKLIYKQGRVRPEITQMLDKDPSDLRAVLDKAEELQKFTPMLAVAATAVIVVLQLMRVAGDEKPDDTIVFHGGRAIVEDLAGIQAKQQGKELAQGEVNQAFAHAMDLYREAATQAGYVNEDALKQTWNQVVAADKEGRLGEISPELAKINELAAKDADAAPMSGMAPAAEGPPQ